MKLYIDTREQRKLEFEVGGEVSEVIITKLPYGDYAGAWEDKHGKHVEFMPVFFERKSLGDLYGTLGAGMERFKRELERAKEDGVKLIIIVEACFAEVKNGYEHSSMEGESILKTLHTLWVKHDIPYILCNDRRDMRDTIVHMFSAIGRNFKPKGNSDEGNNKGKHEEVTISETQRRRMVGEAELLGRGMQEEIGDSGQTEEVA